MPPAAHTGETRFRYWLTVLAPSAHLVESNKQIELGNYLLLPSSQWLALLEASRGRK